jgi:hypothetical protein
MIPLRRLILFTGVLNFLGVLIVNFLTVGSGFLILERENDQMSPRTIQPYALPADTHSYTKNL